MQPLPRTVRGFMPLVRVAPARHGNPAPTTRGLHLSALAGDAVVWTAGSISAIHTTGMPWYLSIPLVAVGVNFFFRLPIQHYTCRLVARRSELSPLIMAWGSRHAATVPRGAGEAAQRIWRLRVDGLTEKSRRRIYKDWGAQRWKTLASLLTMVPFIVISEALRRLCGAPVGWVSHQLGFSNAGTVASGLLDQSLAHGGSLWFVDLTAMDPYYALPLLCSALLARASWGRLTKHQLRLVHHGWVQDFQDTHD